jgi:type IV fimbrial biogenesis protein FimT
MAVGKHNRAFASRASRAGFGLIELVIVIAIVAVLTVIALPSYRLAMQRNRVVTDTNDFVAALNLARNEALARGRPVTVCASVNGTTCDGTGVNDWSGGYMVFTDYDPVGSVDAAAGDTILRVIGPVASRDVLHSTSGNAGYVNFTRLGTANLVGAVDQEVTFQVYATPCVDDTARRISVTSFGRTASMQDTCP